jgi:hypothetical protein
VHYNNTTVSVHHAIPHIALFKNIDNYSDQKNINILYSDQDFKGMSILGSTPFCKIAMGLNLQVKSLKQKFSG